MVLRVENKKNQPAKLKYKERTIIWTHAWQLAARTYFMLELNTVIQINSNMGQRTICVL